MGRSAPGGSKPSMRKALEVFESRNYRLLWTSSSFSFTGMGMQQVTRALLAWKLTASFESVGLVMFSFGLPMLLFSLIGGSLADRFEKRNLSLMTQAGTGVLALITAFLVLTDTITFELLIAVGLVQGTFFAFGMPARTPLMAQAVGPEQIMSAIAMSQASMNATRLIGPALAGVVVGLWGLDIAYFAQSGFYAVSVAVLLMVPTGIGAATRQRAAAGRGNMFVEIGRGLKYVWNDPRLRLLIGMMFIMTLFAMPYITLLAGFVDKDLGQTQSALGWLLSLSGLGALVGSLGVATLTEFNRKPLVQWMAGICGGGGLVLLGVGSAAFGFPGAIVAVMVLGVGFTAYQTMNNTMVMDRALPEYYGRVQSINMLTFSFMTLIGYPLGILADKIGATTTFVAQGVVVLAFMGLIAIINTRYTFGRTDTLDAQEREREQAS